MRRLWILGLCLSLSAVVRADVISQGTNIAHVSQSGALLVDGSAVTQPVSCISGCSGSGSVGVSTVSFGGTAQPVTVQNFPNSQNVAGTFWQSVQPVSVNNVTTTTISGTVPVSGTFWQATQPVSGSLSVSNFPASQTIAGTVAVSNFPASQTVAGTVAISNYPATQPVSIASMPSTPVTGTFWQATQPISGSVSISGTPTVNATAVNVGTVTVSGTVPVSGTFFQATQPVSIASMPSTPVTGTFFQATQPISGTVSATPPTLTKGTQGATGFSTQDLKDAGRQYVVLVATGVAGVTTEALFSFQQSKQGVITQGVGSYTVASGKTLRITGLYCSNRDATTTISWTRAAIRHNPSGATTATSGLLFGLETGGAAALAGSVGSFSAPFPDGIEIVGNGTQSIAVSHLDQATGNLVSCTLTGFEY